MFESDGGWEPGQVTSYQVSSCCLGISGDTWSSSVSPALSHTRLLLRLSWHKCTRDFIVNFRTKTQPLAPVSLLCDRFITELKRETSGKPTIKLHLQNLSQIKLSLSCHKAEPFYCLLSLYFWVANSGNWTNHYWGSSSTMADCGLDCGRHDKTAWYGYKNRHPNNAYILHIPTA